MLDLKKVSTISEICLYPSGCNYMSNLKKNFVFFLFSPPSRASVHDLSKHEDHLISAILIDERLFFFFWGGGGKTMAIIFLFLFFFCELKNKRMINMRIFYEKKKKKKGKQKTCAFNISTPKPKNTKNEKVFLL